MDANPAHQCVDVSRACPGCRAPVKVACVLHIYGGRVLYSEGFRCARCGYGLESDGEEPPDEARASFYANHGRWALVIVDAGSERVTAARALGAALGVTSPDALRMLRSTATLKEGTRVEIEWLERQLRPHGVVVRAIRLDA